jgi:hypothetical protein
LETLGGGGEDRDWVLTVQVGRVGV